MGEVTTLAKQEEIPRGYPEEADWEGGAGGAGGGEGRRGTVPHESL